MTPDPRFGTVQKEKKGLPEGTAEGLLDAGGSVQREGALEKLKAKFSMARAGGRK